MKFRWPNNTSINRKLYWLVMKIIILCSPNSFHIFYLHFLGLDSQVKRLFPDGVEVAIDGLGPLFGLSHLDSDIRITGTSFVLGL